MRCCFDDETVMNRPITTSCRRMFGSEATSIDNEIRVDSFLVCLVCLNFDMFVYGEVVQRPPR